MMMVTILVEQVAVNVLNEFDINWRGCGMSKAEFVRADVNREDAMPIIQLVKESGARAMFDA